MSLIGGTSFPFDDNYWTSTQYSNSGSWELYWNGGRISTFSKTAKFYIRALCQLSNNQNI